VSFLELHDLRKTYADGTVAVKGLRLAVEEGEFVVLLGPSGCGKTTTLRMIAGLEIPTSGQILLAGRDVTALRPSQRDVGFVFQFYALYPHMTVRQNLLFPLESVGMPRAEREQRAQAVAQRMKIEALLGRYPGQLSGGDRQRVGLARAMVRRPALYLMDEPLGTLDADQRVDLRDFIHIQQRELNVTTIYVTHDQEEAMNLADRMVVMEAGQICQIGPPNAVYANPASEYVADFVGTPGMNFMPGTARIEGGKGFVTPDGVAGSIPLDRPLDGRVTVGIRPEHVRRDPDGPITGTVVMDEYQGAFRCIYVDAGFQRPIVLRIGADEDWAVDQPIRLGLDTAHLRLFDPKTGARL